MLLTIDGRRIAYDLLGPAHAPAVVLLHSVAADGGMWAEQVPALLAAGYRVLRIDMRGHGGSEATPGPYRIPDLARDAVAVTDRLALDRFHLIGLSIGGIIAQQIAVTHQPRLLSLMLCDTVASTPAAWPEAWAARVAVAKSAGSVAPLADITTARWLTDDFKARNPARWTEIRDAIAALPLDGYLGAAAALMDFDFRAELPTLRVPTLVVCGAHDEGTPPALNREIAALIPGARYHEIPSARHLPNIEHPEAFNEVMVGWLGGGKGE